VVVTVRVPSTVTVGLVVSVGSCAQAGAARTAHMTIPRRAANTFLARA
jgi:hypothetical protein